MRDGGTCQIRVEIDVERLGLHDRRLAVDLADARVVVRVDDAVFNRLDLGRGNVEQDEALAKVAGIRAQPHDIDLQLLQPRLGRNVQGGERRLVDDAARGDAVAYLEALNARFDERVVRRALPGDVVQIAGLNEPLTQSLHGFRARSNSQLAARDRRETAVGDEALVGRDRLLGGADRRRGENRRRLARQRRPVAGFIALRPIGLRVAALLLSEGRAGDRQKRQRGGDAQDRTPGLHGGNESSHIDDNTSEQTQRLESRPCRSRPY